MKMYLFINFQTLQMQIYDKKIKYLVYFHNFYKHLNAIQISF